MKNTYGTHTYPYPHGELTNRVPNGGVQKVTPSKKLVSRPPFALQSSSELSGTLTAYATNPSHLAVGAYLFDRVSTKNFGVVVYLTEFLLKTLE